MSRSYCFTLNNPTIEETMDIEALEVRYLIYAHEMGVHNTYHLQGYIEMGSVQRLSGMAKLIPRAHFEKRRGTRDQAREYCMKDGEFIEIGKWEAGGKGVRNDITGVMERIHSGIQMKAIMEEMPQVYSNNMRFCDRYRELCEKEDSKDFRKVDVQCYIGDAGSGKTRAAHENNPDIFTVNAEDAFPFDGYDGEKEILIDDFYGGFKYHHLLRILDGHQLRVNVKGSHRYAQWNKVIITSNKIPGEWYQTGLTPALSRRISSVTMFCNEVTGNSVTVTPDIQSNDENDFPGFSIAELDELCMDI